MSQDTKQLASSIQEILSIGYMKALVLAEKVERVKQDKIGKQGFSYPISESYFLPLAFMSDQWVMLAEDMERPYRWLTIFNRDSQGNFIAPTSADADYAGVGIDFALYDGSMDFSLESFDQVEKMIISGLTPKLRGRLHEQFTIEPRDHTMGDEDIVVPLPHDIAGKLWTIKSVSEVIEAQINWNEYGNEFKFVGIAGL